MYARHFQRGSPGFQSGLQLLSSAVAVRNFATGSQGGLVWTSYSGCSPSGGGGALDRTVPVCADLSDVYACLS